MHREAWGDAGDVFTTRIVKTEQMTDYYSIAHYRRIAYTVCRRHIHS